MRKAGYKQTAATIERMKLAAQGRRLSAGGHWVKGGRSGKVSLPTKEKKVEKPKEYFINESGFADWK